MKGYIGITMVVIAIIVRKIGWHFGLDQLLRIYAILKEIFNLIIKINV